MESHNIFVDNDISRYVLTTGTVTMADKDSNV